MSFNVGKDDVTMVKQMNDFHLNVAKIIVSVLDFTIKFFLNSVIIQLFAIITITNIIPIISVFKSIVSLFLTIQLHIAICISFHNKLFIILLLQIFLIQVFFTL
jgi:hypothetical protein